MTEREAIKLLSEIRDSEYVKYMGIKTAVFNEKAIEAFDLAISALEKQEADRWISCKERLPELDTDVLVTDECEEVWAAIYVNWIGEPEFRTVNEGLTIDDPKAWMPFPEPYTEEES